MLHRIAIVCGVGAAIVMGGLFALHVVAPSGPSLRHNPSFSYGQQVFDTIYGQPSGPRNVTQQCRAAIRARADHPQNFDLGEGVAGCKYQEWSYDN